ncbi:MAG: dCTP deaminase [Clostridia bacterium]|nr:dCTP deaminase [Clostridia bacterium]
MVYNGNDIKKLIEEENILDNCNLEYISSGSCDISMSKNILKIKKTFKPIDLSDPEKVENMYEQVEIKDTYNLKPNEIIFVILNEKIKLTKNMVAHIRPRTSLSRLGIMINLQHINAGYEGVLNIAMYNLSPNTYKIKSGMRIGQIVFEELTEGITEDLVYPNEKTPMYQNEDGNIGSKIYVDFIGKVFRHFKGNYYFIENVSMDSETKEDIIVYRPLYEREDSMLWTRPASMFFEKIDENRKDNVTGQKHRFELVEDLSKDYIKENKKGGSKKNE